MSPKQRNIFAFLHCTPRRSIFTAVIMTSLVWMVAVVYFLSLERSDPTRLQPARGDASIDVRSVVHPREVSDDQLRALHRQELQEQHSVDELSAQRLMRKRKEAMEEIEEMRKANQARARLQGINPAVIGQEQRAQERQLFERKMRQAEEEELSERMAGHRRKLPFDKLHRREMEQLSHIGREHHESLASESREGEENLHLRAGDADSNLVAAAQAQDRELNPVNNGNQQEVVVRNEEPHQQKAVMVVNNIEVSREDEPIEHRQEQQQPQLSEDAKNEEKTAGFARHAFNQQESDRIGDYRDIPDSRNYLCKTETYPADLPKASIVICFHNEALSALRRTVNTAIKRGGNQHILEVLLVDDASTMPELQDSLLQNMQSLSPLVRVLHLKERHGLIRGRIRGAEEAKGKIVVFLDSHCEANGNWLVPLIARIHQDRKHVVCPVIDIINLDTLEYQFSPLVRGGFTWALNFNWENIPFRSGQEKELIQPARSPTMAGGLFAMDREYFFEVGAYDKGMDIWGGENLEMSFRVWMCGGTLEIVPCSRVGHIFRQRRPYDDAEGISAMSKNSVRVAEVWMDDYKELYYQQRTFGSDSAGDVTERLEMRKRLHCKSFQWYLEHIYPEKLGSLPPAFKARIEGKLGKVKVEELPANVKYAGQVKVIQFSMCLHVVKNEGARIRPLVGSCARHDDTRHLQEQSWQMTTEGMLRLEDNCLEVAERNELILAPCEVGKSEQSWVYFETKQLIYSRSALKCLRFNPEMEAVDMAECKTDAENHKWKFEPIPAF